jgi:hypothetical protein
MNIVSTMVGLSIMGTAMPMVANMTLQPMMAQKRAENFGIAEAKAVSFAAKNEGGVTLTPTPDGCNVVEIEEQTYSISCIEGENKFKQSATRSFRLAVLTDGEETSSGYTAPVSYTPGIYCPLWDPWGVQSYNAAHNVQCIPVPYSHWAHLYDGPMLW